MKVRKESRRRRPFHTAANYGAFLVARLLIAIIEPMPFRAACLLGTLGGRLAYTFAARERRLALAHLKMAFPDQNPRQRRVLARRSFENMGRSAAVSLVFNRLGPKECRRVCLNYDEYIAHLQRILSGGMGMIALTGHLGNWESLAGIGARAIDNPVSVVANRLNFKPFNRLTERLRRNAGLDIIYLSESPRKIIRVLRANGIVGLLPDQDIRALPGVFVNFFGTPAYTPVGPVLAARLTGAPLIPFFMIHEKAGFRFLWEDPVNLVFTGDRQADLQENTRRWSEILERVIRRFPGQWSWSHRRWKTRPGDPKAGKE